MVNQYLYSLWSPNAQDIAKFVEGVWVFMTITALGWQIALDLKTISGFIYFWSAWKHLWSLL